MFWLWESFGPFSSDSKPVVLNAPATKCFLNIISKIASTSRSECYSAPTTNGWTRTSVWVVCTGNYFTFPTRTESKTFLEIIRKRYFGEVQDCCFSPFFDINVSSLRDNPNSNHDGTSNFFWYLNDSSISSYFRRHVSHATSGPKSGPMPLQSRQTILRGLFALQPYLVPWFWFSPLLLKLSWPWILTQRCLCVVHAVLESMRPVWIWSAKWSDRARQKLSSHSGSIFWVSARNCLP